MELSRVLDAAMECFHSARYQDYQQVDRLLRSSSLVQTFPFLKAATQDTDTTTQICSLLLGTNHRKQKQTTMRHNLDLLIWFGLYLFNIHALRGLCSNEQMDISDAALFLQHCAAMMNDANLSSTSMEFKINLYVYSVTLMSVKRKMRSLLLGMHPFVKREILQTRWRFNEGSINDKYIRSLCNTFEVQHQGMQVRLLIAEDKTSFLVDGGDANGNVFSKVYTIYKLLKDPENRPSVQNVRAPSGQSSDSHNHNVNQSETVAINDEEDDDEYDEETEEILEESRRFKRRRLNIE